MIPLWLRFLFAIAMMLAMDLPFILQYIHRRRINKFFNNHENKKSIKGYKEHPQ